MEFIYEKKIKRYHIAVAEDERLMFNPEFIVI